jgi:hypothetical protein
MDGQYRLSSHKPKIVDVSEEYVTPSSGSKIKPRMKPA